MLRSGDLTPGSYYSVDRQSGDTDTVDAGLAEGLLELVGRVVYQNGRREWIHIRALKPFEVPFVEWPSWAEAEAETRADDQVPPEKLYESGIPAPAEWLDENVVQPVNDFKKALPTIEKVIMGAVAVIAVVAIVSAFRKR